MPSRSPEEYREMQENEILALQAIFEDDFRELEEKNVWNTTSGVCPFVLTLRPLGGENEKPDKTTAVAEISFKFPLLYPDQPPVMTLLSVKGIAEASLHQFLIKTSQQLIGSEMIFELSGAVRDFLAKNYRPEQSFYEQMVNRQKDLNKKEAAQKAMEEHKTKDVQRQIADQEKRQAMLLTDKIEEEVREMERQRELLKQQQKKETERWTRNSSMEDDVFQFDEDTGIDDSRVRERIMRSLSSDSLAKAVPSGYLQSSKLPLAANSPHRFQRLQLISTGMLGCKVVLCLDKISDKPAMIMEFPMLFRSTGPVNRVKYSDSNQLGMGRRIKCLAAIDKELEHLLTLDHDNIIPYLGMNQSIQGDGITVQLASEYVGSTTLENVINQVRRFDINGVRQYTRQLTAGLSYIHSHHIVHGHLCPSAVFITSNGSARLVHGEVLQRMHEFMTDNEAVLDMEDIHTYDLAHSRALQRSGSMGEEATHKYWPAPECMKGKKYDRRSDIWNLGCIVLEMLLGEVDTKKSVSSTLKTVVQHDLRDFLSRCLDVRVRERDTAQSLLRHSFLDPASYTLPPVIPLTVPRAKPTAVTSSIAIPDKKKPIPTKGEARGSLSSSQPSVLSPLRSPGGGIAFTKKDSTSSHTTSRYRTDFEEIQFIGKGGFADVVKVRNRLDGRIYAIKKIRLDGKDAHFNNRIIREVTLLSQLHHEYIVRYYQAWIEDDTDDSIATAETRGRSTRASLGENSSYVSHSGFTASSLGGVKGSVGLASTAPSHTETMSDYFSPRLSDELRFIPKLRNKQPTINGANGREFALCGITSDNDDDGISFDDDGITFGDGRIFDKDAHLAHHDDDVDELATHDRTSIRESDWLATTPNSERNTLMLNLSSRQSQSSSSTDCEVDSSDGDFETDTTEGYSTSGVGDVSMSGRSGGINGMDIRLDIDGIENGMANVRPARLRLYIQMEHCESTLSSLIAEGLPTRPELIWRLFRQIVEGLCHIHKKGMIHRDLKPSNIFLDGDGIIKIGDFGLATADEPRVTGPTNVQSNHAMNGKHHGSAKHQMNEEMTVDTMGDLLHPTNLQSMSKHNSPTTDLTGGVGTALYVSPELEHARKGVRYTQKVDIYSLGIIFFEMCHPMDTTMERVKSIQALRSPKIEFPPTFDLKEKAAEAALIRKMLDHSPRLRPTAFEVLSHGSMPPKMEEAFMHEIQRALHNRNTSSYHTLMTGLFSMPVELHKDFTYDAFASHGLFSRLDSIIRMRITNSAEKILRRHGAIHMATPLLMPRLGMQGSTSDLIGAKGKTDDETGSQVGMDLGEPSACVLMDRSGGLVTLPYDLTQSFTRFIARHKISKLKRYVLGQVYRENQPLGTQPRAINSLEFHIVDPKVDTQLPEAEVIKVVAELLSDIIPHIARTLYVRINHFRLVEAIFVDCGVCTNETQSHTSVGLKRDDSLKTTAMVRLIMSQPVRHAGEVARRLVAQAKLSKYIVNRLFKLLSLTGPLAEVEKTLLSHLSNNHAKLIASAAFSELRCMVSYLDNMQISYSVTLDTSLISSANGARGCLFQFVRESVRKDGGGGSGGDVSTHGASGGRRERSNSVGGEAHSVNKLDIFAYGGQFDHYMKKFMHPTEPAPRSKVYGVSVAFDRLVALHTAEAKRQRKTGGGISAARAINSTGTDTQVFVCSVGDREKVEGYKCHIASTLWNAGIPTEMDYSGTRSVEVVQDECREDGIVYLVVAKDNSAIRVRNLFTRVEDDVTLSELTDYIRQGLTTYMRTTMRLHSDRDIHSQTSNADLTHIRGNIGPHLSLTGRANAHAPVILDPVVLNRLKGNDKKRMINRASQRIAPFFEELSVKHVCSVACLDIPDNVMRDVAMTMDIGRDATKMALLDKYRIHRQQIAILWNFIEDLETKLPFLFLYSCPDDTCVLMTIGTSYK
eukprot:CFRG7534T1